MSHPDIVRSLHILISILVISVFGSANVFADIKKYVYVYDKDGQLLTPSNAAKRCPHPKRGKKADNICKGVLVDKKGEYELQLPDGDLEDKDNVILRANTYVVNNEGKDDESYILLKSKRRVDRILKDDDNDGLDINPLSEIAVQAIEEVHRLGRSKKHSDETKLSEKLKKIDVEKLNKSLHNSRYDNKSKTKKEKRKKDKISHSKKKLKDDDDDNELVSLAKLALENEDDDDITEYIRKNVAQIISQPEFQTEVSNRVFSHVSRLQLKDIEQSLILLEADTYFAASDEVIKLNTSNSINSSKFFAYTWNGVSSEISKADFNKPSTGSYLVCVTGEADSDKDTSTDCVRLAILQAVDAKISTTELRIPISSTVSLSASLSEGANSYTWSGVGEFSDSAVMETTWTAPSVSGEYTVELIINNGVASDTVTLSVFDNTPIAIAVADSYKLSVIGQTAIAQLTSESAVANGSDVDAVLWEIVKSPLNSTPKIVDPAARTTQFRITQAGEYHIQLTASKGSLSDRTRLILNAVNSDSIDTNAGGNITTFRNQPVLLNATRTTSTSTNTLSYLWQSVSGSISKQTEAKTVFVTDSIGEYQISLKVSDGLIQSTDTIIVSVVNHIPVASDDVVANLLNEILYERALAKDDDNDSLVYELLSQPSNGGVTMDVSTGDYTYIPGGVKGCQYKASTITTNTSAGTKNVPVIKLCADRYSVAPGETINLTTSNSISASKLSGFAWSSGIIADPNDNRLASFSSLILGSQKLCVTGNIGQSKNTSTACVEVLVSGESSKSLSSDIESGYVERFQYQVSDGIDKSNIATITITIGWENSVPQVSDLAVTIEEDQQTTAQLTVSDVDSQPLQFRIVENGQLGVLSFIDTSIGLFRYIPNSNAVGVDSIRVVANDGFGDSNVATISITLSAVNDAPSISTQNNTLTTVEDTPVVGQLLATDVDGDSLTYSIAVPPSVGSISSFNAATGSFTYTPNANINGEDNLYFMVSDGTVSSNISKLSINISPVNDVPLAEDQGVLVVDADKTLSGKLSASDKDKDVLVYRIISAPNQGSVKLNRVDGTFVYTPNVNSKTEDSFVFVAEDRLTQSNTASVSISILPANNAPVSDKQTIQVFQSVSYGGTLTASDIENSALSFNILSKPRLGSVEIVDKLTGNFIYRPTSGVAGNDYFTFTATDDSKTSPSATVTVKIIERGLTCKGPDHVQLDDDKDGYANFIESALGTLPNDANSIPFDLKLSDFNIVFNDDEDSDNFTDISELWMGTNYLDADSYPSNSRLAGVPNCFSVLYDNISPILQAFSITTPTLNIMQGEVLAKFRTTILDNASGVNQVELELQSPAGNIIKAKFLNKDENSLVLQTDFSSETFGENSQAGIWLVNNFTLTDKIGNSVKLSTQDLRDRSYPVEVNVSNGGGSDITKPTLTFLSILTNPLDITDDVSTANFLVNASDNLSGLQRITIELVSPSGSYYHIAESLISNAPLSLANKKISSDIFRQFEETGSWKIAKLSIADVAGNVLTYDTTALAISNYSTGFTVTRTQAPTITRPTITDLDLLTPTIQASKGGQKAKFRLNASSSAGIKNVALSLEGPSGVFMQASYSNLGTTTILDTQFESPMFATDAPLGFRNYSKLSITDNANNVFTWSGDELAALGFLTQLEVIIGPCNLCPPPILPPYAYIGRFSFNEDTSITETLNAIDTNSAALPLVYSISSQPSMGSVTLNDRSTGRFTYTPEANKFGNDQFTFQVDNGSHQSNIATVYLTINSVPDPTTAENLNFKVTENTPFSASLVGNDNDGLDLTYEIVDSDPATSGSVVITDVINGSFTFTPATDLIGADSFTYRVTDGNSAYAEATVSLAIIPEMELIGFNVISKEVSAFAASFPIISDVTLTKDIFYIDAAMISIIGPSGQEMVLHAPILENSYPFRFNNNVTTDVNSTLETGTWSFKNLRIKKKSEKIYKILVEDIAALGFPSTFEVIGNTPPKSALNLVFSTTLNKPLADTLIVTDAENDPLQFLIAQQSTLGSVTLTDTSTGAFVYTPRVAGNDSFRFIVNDGHSNSNVAIVNITITEVDENIAPTAVTRTFKSNINTAYIGTLEAYDNDENSLTYVLVSSPKNGSVTIDDIKGSFVYRPENNFTGSATFSFKVNDGLLDSNTASVTITVEANNRVPRAIANNIIATENTSYVGSVNGIDPDGDELNFNLTTPATFGSVQLNTATGSFVYTPLANYIGQDSFQFVAIDAELSSDAAVVSIDILSKKQVCGTGGIDRNLDQDGDGYIDYLEQVLGTDADDSNSSPQDLSTIDFNTIFNDDDDGDGFKDNIELWLGTDASNILSKPSQVLSECFNSLSDGIKPRLIGFSIDKQFLNIGGNDNTVNLSFSLLDNASGIKRIRINLLSPSGSFMTISKSYTTLPIFSSGQLVLNGFTEFSEQGQWSVSSITIYDGAGNRLNLNNDDLVNAKLPNSINVTNAGADATAPTLDQFSILNTEIFPASIDSTIKVQVSASDSNSGVKSIRIDFISPSGVIMSSSRTLAQAASNTTLQLDTEILSPYAKEGTWMVYGVLLVDVAGNSAQYGSQLNGLGFNDRVQIVNPQSDGVAPRLESLSILADVVYPYAGDARIRIASTLSDDTSGIERVQVLIEGPSGQIKTLWGEFSNSSPVNAQVQLESEILNQLTEIGQWKIVFVEIIDSAGNTALYDNIDLTNQGYEVTIEVSN